MLSPSPQTQIPVAGTGLQSPDRRASGVRELIFVFEGYTQTDTHIPTPRAHVPLCHKPDPLESVDFLQWNTKFLLPACHPARTV